MKSPHRKSWRERNSKSMSPFFLLKTRGTRPLAGIWSLCSFCKISLTKQKQIFWGMGRNRRGRVGSLSWLSQQSIASGPRGYGDRFRSGRVSTKSEQKGYKMSYFAIRPLEQISWLLLRRFIRRDFVSEIVSVVCVCVLRLSQPPSGYCVERILWIFFFVFTFIIRFIVYYKRTQYRFFINKNR